MLDCVGAALVALLVCSTAAVAPAADRTTGPPPTDVADDGVWQTAAGPFSDLQPAMLSLYKTITYTAAVLATDQLWYMGVAAQAATTGTLFGVINVVTSPMLTYVFEYGWERCCEAPPGPDGLRPVDTRKAIIYRVLSSARVFGLVLLLGNGLGSSALVTVGIGATRTLVYMTNELIWNRLTASGATLPPPPGLAFNR